ncbi:MAG: MFS transporter [Pseudomonadota bacterium]
MAVTVDNEELNGAEQVVDQRTKRNVAALFTAQAIGGAQLPINMTFAPLIGAALADDPRNATLPISVMVLAVMLTSPVASMVMERIGRKAGFLIGCAVGAVGGVLAIIATLQSSFLMFLFGIALIGSYQAHQNLYRFAATDTAPDFFKPKAIAWVLGGGLVAAILGPPLAAWTKDMLLPVPLAGAYIAVVVVNVAAALPLLALDIPKPEPVAKSAEGTSEGRSLVEIFRQPDAMVALLCGMVSYALMTLMMTSTSTAMVLCGHSETQAVTVVGFHVIAMFGPSFFTGNLITRFGVLPIIFTGLLLTAASGVVAAHDVTLGHFYVSLILLGLGWNFGFIGASSLLALSHRPEERARVQGFNDFCVFGLVALASLASGRIMHASGWATITLVMVPFLILSALSLAWLAGVKRRAQG